MESGTKKLEKNQEIITPEKRKRTRKKPAARVGVAPAVEDVSHFLDNIKLDWKLFWAGIAGEEEIEDIDPFETGKLEILTIEQVKKITRALSNDRKKINQKLEQIHREIDQNTERIESILLVGGDSAETVEEINKLNEAGLKLSLQLEKVNQQLDRARSREDELKGLR